MTRRFERRARIANLVDNRVAAGLDARVSAGAAGSDYVF